MAWSINAIRIFVQAAPKAKKQIVSRHNVLAGGSIHQAFGYDEGELKLKALAVGETDATALEALITSGAVTSLVTPWATLSVWVTGVSVSPKLTTCQTIRADLALTATVYDVELDLYIET